MRTPRTDRASLEIPTTPERLYDAFSDAAKLMQWLPPAGMTGRALTYEFWEGGHYRFALTYEAEGKTDVSKGRFVTLEAGRKIVQVGELESTDPDLAGEMTLTWTFEPTGQGTMVRVTAEHVPPGIGEQDHADGLRSTLENLARFAR
jgi:uncharacterized protein YndB with AHSA1/START domain